MPPAAISSLRVTSCHSHNYDFKSTCHAASPKAWTSPFRCGRANCTCQHDRVGSLFMASKGCRLVAFTVLENELAILALHRCSVRRSPGFDLPPQT